ncbi:MAG: DUF3352 domain-containing protein, partial [Phormidesmis sp. RL_2_1]|nr:DUF3352 domain-containing protein [Phormidesmis sp. RL_2_1]
SDAQPGHRLVGGEQFLPANSTIALTGHDLSHLIAALASVKIAKPMLPDFFRLDHWPTADYVMGQLTAQSSTNDWILVIARDPEQIAKLDEAAMAEGYSAVPVAIGEHTAVTWTRFKARLAGQRQFSGGLETEILGLHLSQGDREIFASSLGAMHHLLARDESNVTAEHRALYASDRTPAVHR